MLLQIVRQVDYLQVSFQGARSTEHKILHGEPCPKTK